MKNTKKRGFTIVELVIVIAVIAILASVLIPTFSGVVAKAKKYAALQDARNAWTAYLADEALNGKDLPGVDGCIKSGELYFEVKAGTFTGEECSNTTAHKYYTIASGKLVAPEANTHTASAASGSNN